MPPRPTGSGRRCWPVDRRWSCGWSKASTTPGTPPAPACRIYWPSPARCSPGPGEPGCQTVDVSDTQIVDAEVLVTSPGRNFVTLRLRTADGVVGLGDATVNGRELAVVSYLRDHV